MTMTRASITDMTPRAKVKRDFGDATDLELHPLIPEDDDSDDNDGLGLQTDPEDRKRKKMPRCRRRKEAPTPKFWRTTQKF